MQTLHWLNVYLLLVSGFGLYKLGKSYVKTEALFKLFFILSLAALGGKCVITIFSLRGELWAKLSTILFVLSGLLELVRVSKPIYFRFPVYLSYLPILSLLLLPFIRDSKALYDLINITYQGGAIVVSIPVIVLLHFKSKRLYGLLLGIGFLLTSYILFWFFKEAQLAAYLMLGAGIASTAKGFDMLAINGD